MSFGLATVFSWANGRTASSRTRPVRPAATWWRYANGDTTPGGERWSEDRKLTGSSTAPHPII
jgi:hypothetical protein